MPTLWLNFPQSHSQSFNGCPSCQPDVDFLVPISRELAVDYAKELIGILKESSHEKHFVWESLKCGGEDGYSLLAQIRTDHFWLDILLSNDYFVPVQKIEPDHLVYKKIARIPKEDAKELVCILAVTYLHNDMAMFQKFIHEGLGIDEGEREEPYDLLQPTLTVDEMDENLQAYMSQAFKPHKN